MPEKKTYWAKKPPAELAPAALKQMRTVLEVTEFSREQERIRKILNLYYGRSGQGVSYAVSAAGRRREYKMLHINELRSLVTHVLALVANQRIAYDVRPRNDDVGPRQAAKLGGELLEGYVRFLRLTNARRRATEMALITDEGYMRLVWDPTMGRPIAVDEEDNPVYEGDIKVRVYSKLDVIRDRTQGDSPWRVYLDEENRWDLAARYPEKAEEILNAQGPRLDYDRFRGYDAQRSPDKVTVGTLMHERTPALPQGLEFKFISEDLWLSHGPLPYPRIPDSMISASEVIGSDDSYTPISDVAGLNEALNRTVSAILTNQLTFGVQNVKAPRGSNVKPRKIANGMNLLEFDVVPGVAEGGAPSSLDLLRTPAEMFNAVDMYRGMMSDQLGISPATKGDMLQRLSGSAFAFLDSRSLEFLSGLQESVTTSTERMGQLILDVLKERAHEPRIARLVGESGTVRFQTFQTSELEGADLVTVESANPLSQTLAGRVTLADNMLERGLIKDPADYLSAVNTGRVTPIFESDRLKRLYVDAENQSMARGEPVLVMETDDDDFHIERHVNELVNSIEARKNPEILQLALAHINEHKQNKQIKLLAEMQNQMVGAPPPAGQAPGDPASVSSPADVSGQISPPQQPSQPSLPEPPEAGGFG